MKFEIRTYSLVIVTITFVFFTIIGTISHEFGHIIVAKFLGHKTTLQYGSMTYERSNRYANYEKIYSEYKHEIRNNLSYPKKAEFEKFQRRLKTESILITLGGPIQTTFTGLLGLLLLFLRRKQIRNTGLTHFDWLFVFMSLFWLRELFNIVVSISSGLIEGNGTYFGGDEAKISQYLELPIWTIGIVLGIIGLVSSIFVIFKIIPSRMRLTFISGGFIGGIIGFILWMKVIGPIILPC